ncbi:MAG: DUF1259 domain-containing protein [Acidobacteria bacterium]|nr:DUF1259 domain-containing protein [Acidobacteriota bacterium]
MLNTTRIGIALALALPLAAGVTEAQRAKIDEVTGAKGTYTAAEDVYRVTFPRTDVKVAIEGRAMHPFLGLTSWAAFTANGQGGVMVTGDLVLFEDEVNPVMSAALEQGLEVTALHNHFFYETPRVMFMHIGGTGPAEQLAAAVRKALNQVKAVRSSRPSPAPGFGGSPVPEASSITASVIDGILGVKGQANAGMYKAQLGRQATMHGQAVGNQMGVNTWAAFAGTDEVAFVDGDFAMLISEVQPVLKALRQAGVNIVALHNHMTHEQPQYVFLHYWGKGPAPKLAQAVKAGLDAQQPKQAGRIVFVCEHGAARSVIAAAYFNKLAAERGLPHRAITRGTVPDAEFGAVTVAGLRADGIPLPPGKPQLVGVSDLTGAEEVVTFAVNLPDGLPAVKRVDWANIPGPTADYTGARNAIEARVRALIDELAAAHH